jgi:riboflavin synthase
MFTGIIEALGTIASITETGTNKTFWISSQLSNQLKVDQSVSHNGVCLTVEEVQDTRHRVTAIEESIRKTNIAFWSVGQLVNLERCLMLNGRLDGHIVQGHVDTSAACIAVKELDGSWEYRFQIEPHFAHLIIEKGSICLNGISLTIFNVSTDAFRVAIIPFTYHHTNIRDIQTGSMVNIEFDMIGKYVNRFNQLGNPITQATI